jgi:hypothetical protein
MPDKVIRDLLASYFDGLEDDSLAPLRGIFLANGGRLEDDDLMDLYTLADDIFTEEAAEDVTAAEARRRIMELLRGRDPVLNSSEGEGRPPIDRIIASLLEDSQAEAVAPFPLRQRVRLAWLADQDPASFSLAELARLAALPGTCSGSVGVIQRARAELVSRGFRCGPHPAAEQLYIRFIEQGRPHFEVTASRIILHGEVIHSGELAGYAVHRERTFSPLSCLCWCLWLVFSPLYLPGFLIVSLTDVFRRKPPLDGCFVLYCLPCIPLLPICDVLGLSPWQILCILLLFSALLIWKFFRDQDPARWRVFPELPVFTLRLADGRERRWRVHQLWVAEAAEDALQRFLTESRLPLVEEALASSPGGSGPHGP